MFALSHGLLWLSVRFRARGNWGYIAHVRCDSAGVKAFDVSLDTQTADVTTEEGVDYASVLEKIKKTGKKVNSGEADGVTQAV